MKIQCKCGCGTEITLSRSTYYRVKNGQPGGYVQGHNQIGSNNSQWKGGKTKDKRGYVLIRQPKHPNAWPNGMIPEHRFIMSEHLGRALLFNEVVHHLNGNSSDNRLANLVVIARGVHSIYHNKGKKRH